jgi:hypothetical protein
MTVQSPLRSAMQPVVRTRVFDPPFNRLIRKDSEDDDFEVQRGRERTTKRTTIDVTTAG